MHMGQQVYITTELTRITCKVRVHEQGWDAWTFIRIPDETTAHKIQTFRGQERQVW